jgi:SAM-dependent methyltransferase
MNRDVESFYSRAYEEVMGRGAIGFVWKFIHTKIDSDLGISSESILLELGSGHGQHFAQFKLPIKLYIQSDFQETLGYSTVFSNSDLAKKGMIKRLLDAEDLTHIPTESIDCVVMTCVLAHLKNPEKSLSEIRRVLKPSGVFRIYIPCEPGMFLRFARFFSTKRELKRLGIVQEDIHWQEHRNHYPAMNFWIEKTFDLDVIVKKKYPFNLLIWDLNLFSIIRISKALKD